MNWPTILGLLWLVFVAGVSVIYRGLNQSLTIDEAYTYHHFLNQGASALLEKYQANYHLLPTWFMWLAVHKFGKSEAIIRLPSMVSALFYLGGVWVLSRRLMGNDWRFLVALVLLTAHPVLADYFSAARGYGPAVAFYTWAFCALLNNRLAVAGVLMALSVLCHLTFLVPAMSAAVAYAVYQVSTGGTPLPLLKRFPLAFLGVIAPGAAIVLWDFQPGGFYYGAAEWALSLTTLVAPSLAYGEPVAPVWTLIAQRAAIPLGLMAIGLSLASIRQRALNIALPGITLAISILALFAGHTIAGIPYPWTRTGLYLIWLFLVALLAAWEFARSQRSWVHRLGLVFGATSLLLAGLFVGEFDTRYYFEFREDARVDVMMQTLRDRNAAERNCVGGSWRYVPTVNYYRLRYRLERIEEMKWTEKPEAGCRYYVLEAADKSSVQRLDLRPLWTDPISKSIVAEKIP